MATKRPGFELIGGCYYTDDDVAIYALSPYKVCLTCHSSFKADKPWYFNCKKCCGKIETHNKGGGKCIYCAKEFYKNIRVLRLESGSYYIGRNLRDVATTRRVIPNHLKEEEKRIPSGVRFSNSVCYDHLSTANEKIARLSPLKARRWSQSNQYPPLFRLKCLKMSHTPLVSDNKETLRLKLLNLVDDCPITLILTVLRNNHLPLELRQFILKTLLFNGVFNIL